MKMVILNIINSILRIKDGLFKNWFSNEPLADYQKNPNFETFQAANADFDKAIKADPNDEFSSIMRAYLLSMELDRSLQYFEQNIDSLETGTKFQYANLLLGMNRFEDALKVYDIITEAIPKWSCPWRHKGETLMKLDRWEEAETATQKSIDVRPDHYDAFVQLAEIQKHLDKKEAALKSIEKAVSLMDENDEEEISKNYIYQLYADILLLNNMQDKADAIQMKIK